MPAVLAWFECVAPTHATPLSRASATAVSAARLITRWPMPLSPSTSAVAGAVWLTAIFGLLLKPPALRRRTYCGSRKMPWPSAPVRSASVISSAHLAASASGRPAATNVSLISAYIARAGTRTKAGAVIASARPRGLLAVHGALADQRQRAAAEDHLLVDVGDRQRPHLPRAFERSHVVGIVATEHDAAGAGEAHQAFELWLGVQDGVEIERLERGVRRVL